MPFVSPSARHDCCPKLENFEGYHNIFLYNLVNTFPAPHYHDLEAVYLKGSGERVEKYTSEVYI